MLAGPWLAGLDPTTHVYPATVWILLIWTALHVGARHRHAALLHRRQPCRPADPEFDIDIRNVALFWHFLAVTAVITVAVVALFPMVA